MSYVLSVIHPPEAPAVYGNAQIIGPVHTLATVQLYVIGVLDNRHGVPNAEAQEFAEFLTGADISTEATHRPTSLTFRIDPADNAPHPCPCCGRLVLPADHADAHMEDAYCTGCFTWNRGDVQCLPANTAHTEEP